VLFPAAPVRDDEPKGQTTVNPESAVPPDAAAHAPALIHYLPIATTIISVLFFAVLMRHWLRKRSGAHILWWASGIFFYGLGTALESAITLTHNTAALNKAWYIFGALLGGYPLAQGTVFLLLHRRTALVLTAISVPFILLASVAVILSPVNHEAMLPYKPGGDVIAWQWVRLMTPFINIYAALFLIGGAILSASKYAHHIETRSRAVGNAFIAVGAILPGIGGSMAKGGIVEALYIGEFLGLILIWIGYRACVAAPRAPAVEL